MLASRGGSGNGRDAEDGLNYIVSVQFFWTLSSPSSYVICFEAIDLTLSTSLPLVSVTNVPSRLDSSLAAPTPTTISQATPLNSCASQVHVK